MESLRGKTAVITGASSGIGKAIASTLAREGMDVCLAARGKERLEATAKQIADEFGVRALAVPCDVSQLKDLESLAATAIAELGRVNALINNAGLSSQSLFHEQSIEDISRLMYTNFFGYVALTRLLINHMVEKGGGSIVNIVSGSTLINPPPRTFIVYSSLKWAVRAFGNGLFGEMRDQGIKVTSVLPGVTNTTLTSELDQKMLDPERLMETGPIERAVVFALTQPANVCSTEVSVINQQSVWKIPVR